MKKLSIILLLFCLGCSLFESRQEKAERLVKEYIQSGNPKADIKDMKFTAFDPGSNIIGVIENKTVYDTNHHPIFIRTVYYVLKKDLTGVDYEYTL